MSLLPPPSRRVLLDLAARLGLDVGTAGHGASPVRRALAELLSLLAAQEAAWAETDHIGAALAARVDLPRVTLPTGPGEPGAYATDVGTIRARFGPGPAARRLTAALRRRRRAYRAAAEAVGLPAAEARDRALAADIHDMTAGLLLAPARDRADLAVKVAVLVALSEPGPADAAGWPGLYLRALLANLHPPPPGRSRPR